MSSGGDGFHSTISTFFNGFWQGLVNIFDNSTKNIHQSSAINRRTANSSSSVGSSNNKNNPEMSRNFLRGTIKSEKDQNSRNQKKQKTNNVGDRVRRHQHAGRDQRKEWQIPRFSDHKCRLMTFKRPQNEQNDGRKEQVRAVPTSSLDKVSLSQPTNQLLGGRNFLAKKAKHANKASQTLEEQSHQNVDKTVNVFNEKVASGEKGTKKENDKDANVIQKAIESTNIEELAESGFSTQDESFDEKNSSIVYETKENSQPAIILHSPVTGTEVANSQESKRTASCLSSEERSPPNKKLARIPRRKRINLRLEREGISQNNIMHGRRKRNRYREYTPWVYSSKMNLECEDCGDVSGAVGVSGDIRGERGNYLFMDNTLQHAWLKSEPGSKGSTYKKIDQSSFLLESSKSQINSNNRSYGDVNKKLTRRRHPVIKRQSQIDVADHTSAKLKDKKFLKRSRKVTPKSEKGKNNPHIKTSETSELNEQTSNTHTGPSTLMERSVEGGNCQCSRSRSVTPKSAKRRTTRRSQSRSVIPKKNSCKWSRSVTPKSVHFISTCPRWWSKNEAPKSVNKLKTQDSSEATKFTNIRAMTHTPKTSRNKRMFQNSPNNPPQSSLSETNHAPRSSMGSTTPQSLRDAASQTPNSSVRSIITLPSWGEASQTPTSSLGSTTPLSSWDETSQITKSKQRK